MILWKCTFSQNWIEDHSNNFSGDFLLVCGNCGIYVSCSEPAERPETLLRFSDMCFNNILCQGGAKQRNWIKFSNIWQQPDIQIFEASLHLTMESLCGICGAKGLKKQLVLFQLNLEEAILMCESKEVCTFSWTSLLPFIVSFSVVWNIFRPDHLTLCNFVVYLSFGSCWQFEVNCSSTSFWDICKPTKTQKEAQNQGTCGKMSVSLALARLRIRKVEKSILVK